MHCPHEGTTCVCTEGVSTAGECGHTEGSRTRGATEGELGMDRLAPECGVSSWLFWKRDRWEAGVAAV